ncbi:putative phage protein gp47/JayE [Sphingomonas sp. BE270]|jgi:uncharacterized phage protein gp47/JayE|uniref:baseplate J/gp47 family protein n=1 Tax=Sphingomonas sp. BE270 TaxID=2817726 RepID=UPI00286657F2|nr:baseplate J/gp47 family protein [Sphingomonas sp. BE270]MDR7259884.1 putative phage protein gp47/JayE [Sphingomonas sp. BE270]
MPFARPNLSQIRVTAATGINSVLTGLDALLRWSNLGIIAEVLAGLVDGLYGYLDWIALQSNPFTATDEYLEGWAALKGVTRKPATSAVGAAIFAGTNSTVVPTGSLVSRSDGVSYLTTADATVIAGAATVPIRASVAGIDGNGAAGVALTLGVGISGISASGTSSGPLTGGASVETDASLRSRMLIAYQKPPQGGSIDDYGEWALAVPGVTRVWVIPSGMGPGSVVLFFMMDDVQAAHGGFPQGSNGCARLETRDTPATGDQLALANALYFQQPVTALVYAVAPTQNVIGLTIAGLSTASTTTKADIAAAFANALLVAGRPGGVTNISAIEAAIAAVALTGGFVLTNVSASAGTVSPGATGNITSNAGALPVPGAIIYI